MASPAALILGRLKSKGPTGSLPGEPAAPGSSDAPLDAKAESLKSMWDNMKAGDFKAAALDFHDAYMACHDAESAESTPDDEGGSDSEDDYTDSEK
jgi:hypothetical protein